MSERMDQKTDSAVTAAEIENQLVLRAREFRALKRTDYVEWDATLDCDAASKLASLRKQLEEAQRLLREAHSLDRAIASIDAPAPSAGETVLDWARIAKAAGTHGVRYRTNSALEAFLREIAPTTGETP